MAAKKLYSTAQLAAEAEVSAGKAKKYIEAEGIDSVEVKGNCKYFDSKALAAVKRAKKAEEKEALAKKKAKEKEALAKKKAAEAKKKAAEKKKAAAAKKKATTKKTTKKK